MTTSLSDRVATLRRHLRSATTYDQALLACSTADTATLRNIEPDYYTEPVSATVLRETIAAAHAERAAGPQAADTDQVTPELFNAWVYATLNQWLPGATDFDARFGGQYLIQLLGLDHRTGGQRYQVSTPDGHDRREFVVTVTAAPS